MPHSRICIVFLAFTVGCAADLRADDWPQWLGPQRDGVWREKDLLTAFPKEGIRTPWRVPAGGGFAGPAVANGRVYLTDFHAKPNAPRPANPFQRITQPGVERVLCLDQATGKQLWAYEYDVDYTMSYSAGPRTTPLVDHGQVYTLGGEGDLLCLDALTGKLAWTKHLSTRDTPTPMWGFAANLLVDGPRLICVSGGTDPEHGHGVVTAYDKSTGNVIWSALSAKEPGYSSPMIYQIGRVRQLIVWTPVAVNSLDPLTGRVYWSQPFGPAQQGLSVVTPIWSHDPQLGDVLLVSTQFDGSLLLKLDDQQPRASVLWKRVGKSDRMTDALHTLLSPPIIRDGHIYGIDCYGQLRCLDLKTGDRLWETFAATTYDAGPQKWASAFLIPLGPTGSRYVIANEHGDLILADLDPTGYRQVSKAHVLEPTNTDPGRAVVWSFPACAGRRIFWRNDKELVCGSMSDQAE